MHPWVGPLSGEAEPEKTQQVLAIPGPSSGDTEGNERGRGLGHWLCPTCPVLPQALFESPPTFPDRSSSSPFSSSSSFCSTQAEAGSTQPWTRAGRRGEARARSGAGEAGDPA